MKTLLWKNLWRVDGLKQHKQPTKMSIFPNLSFREVCWCQGTLHPLLIRREHLVNAAKKHSETVSRKHGNLLYKRNGCVPSYTFTRLQCNLLFHGNLAVLVGVKRDADVSKTEQKGLYSVTHGGSKWCCVRPATIQAELSDDMMFTYIFSRKTCLHALFLAAL